MESLEHVLASAAQAEEGYRTAHPSYTTDIVEELEEVQGFEVEPGITLLISYADEDRYCIEASWRDLTYFYDSSQMSEPQEGTCPPVVSPPEQVLHDMAVAQESFRTSHPRYTHEIEDLVVIGVDIPDGLDVSIVLANRFDYCMEARAGGLHWRYRSQKRHPQEGVCAKGR